MTYYTPIREHEMMRDYWTSPVESVSIYTIQEAVDALKKLISPI